MIRPAFLLAAIVILFSPSRASAASPTWRFYDNQNYGYSERVPAYLAIETDPPPAPHHGFKITLGPGRAISVDASYDSTFLGSAESAIQDRAGDDGISDQTKLAKNLMAGLYAERVQALVRGQRIDLAVAYRPNGNNAAIIYTFELDTDAIHQAQDEPIFDEILHSFLLLTLPK